jgi:UDP-N-acetylglucosamine 2-epimerase (non-hydrolysing)
MLTRRSRLAKTLKSSFHRSPMHIVLVVGTRPNFMKIAPLLDALSHHAFVDQTLIHTGQHYDPELSDAFLDDLEMPFPDHFLGVGSGTHAEQAARVMLGLEPILNRLRPDVVVVAGDVNSTMAAAITSTKLGIALVHLEAGLRSHDRSMPEEHNRVIADHLADLLLTPTADADGNLAAEGIPRERIARVGNVMIDSLRRHLGDALALDLARREYGVKEYVLVTLHRPSLVDDRCRLLGVVDALERIARDRPVLFPVHPRTRARLRELGQSVDRILLLQPQGYLRFLSLEASAAAVITDSGGVQEETTVLGVPCFTMRSNTERPITVSEGTNCILGTEPAALDLLRSELPSLGRRAPRPPHLWDGRAAVRAAQAIADRFGARAEPLPTRAGAS